MTEKCLSSKLLYLGKKEKTVRNCLKYFALILFCRLLKSLFRNIQNTKFKISHTFGRGIGVVFFSENGEIHPERQKHAKH